MSAAENARRARFSLRLEQGLGRLVLKERLIGEWLVVDRLHLGLDQVPARIDMSAGVERFRHQRAQLEELVVHVDDVSLTQALASRLTALGITGVEVRAVAGELVIVGELAGEGVSPFVARARIEPASIASERAALLSFYEVRIFGAAEWTGGQLAQALLTAAGLESRLAGPTAAVIDPIDDVLHEISAELGWKAPDRRASKLIEIRCDAGTLGFSAARGTAARVGPRQLGHDRIERGARLRRFLADYEAKSLYASVEALIGEGRLARAATAYARQLEVHPKHPFLVRRLLSLWSVDSDRTGDLRALARANLAADPEHIPSLRALAVAELRADEPAAAAAHFRRIAEIAEGREQGADRAQALRAVAAAVFEIEPQMAVEALESALRSRRQLPGALAALAELHSRLGDWAAALRVRERLLAAAHGPARRGVLLRQLGRLALDQAGQPEAARSYFERAVDLDDRDRDALRGLAESLVVLGETLSATRTLDRAVRIAQEHGAIAEAAELMVRLGRVWLQVEVQGPTTAALRFRQALLLSPDHADALMGLAECAEQAGDRTRALGRLEEALRSFEGLGVLDERVGRVHLQMGRLLAAVPGAQDRAVMHLQHAVRAGGGVEEDASTALIDQLTAAQRWGDVVRALEWAASRAEDARTQVARLTQLAQVLAHRLGDSARAQVLLMEAAQIAPAEVIALEALVQLSRDAERWPELADALGELAVRLTDPGSRAAAHAERGELLRLKLNRSDEAVEAYAFALGCDPHEGRALAGLVDLYRERERSAELADLLGRLAQHLEHGSEAGLAWLERGRLEMDHLDRPTQALSSLNAALIELADDTEVLRRLGDLQFDRTDYDAALRHYLALRDLYDEDGYEEEAAGFLSRLATTLVAVGRDRDAVATLNAALENDPNRVDLLEQLQDVLLRSGDLAGVVSAFEQQLDKTADEEVKVFMARRGGRIAWRELRDGPRAQRLLAVVLGLRSDDKDAHRLCLEIAEHEGSEALALEHLRALSTADEGDEVEPAFEPEPAVVEPAAEIVFEDDEDPLEDALEALPEELAEEPPEESAGHAAPQTAIEWLAAAEARRDDAHDPDGALPMFERAVAEAVPGDEIWVEAIEALEDIFTVRTDWDALLGLYDRRIEAGIGDPAELALLKASIHRTVGRIDAAIECARAAAPSGERALEVLVELLDTAGRGAEGAQLLLHDLGALGRDDAAHRKWRAARLLATSDSAQALTLLGEAAADLKDPLLVEDWLAAARSADVADAIVAALDLSAGCLVGNGAQSARRSSLRLEAARIALERLDDPSLARRLAEHALADWPDNVEAIAVLIATLARLDDMDALANALDAEVAAALPGPWRGRSALRLAKVCADRLADVARALAAAQMAVEDLVGAPEQAEAEALVSQLCLPVDRVGDLVASAPEAPDGHWLRWRVALDAERWADLVQAGDAALTAGFGPAQAADEIRESMALAHLDHLGDPEAAVRVLEQMAPPPNGRPGIAALFLRAARAAGAWDALASAFGRAVEQTVPLADRTQTELVLIAALSDHLGRPAEALERALSLRDALGAEAPAELAALIERLES